MHYLLRQHIQYQPFGMEGNVDQLERALRIGKMFYWKPRVSFLILFQQYLIGNQSQGLLCILLRFLLGSKQRVTIVIPGDSIEELSICEMTKGGTDLEQNKVTA